MSETYSFHYSCSPALRQEHSRLTAMLRDLFYGQAFRLYRDHEVVVELTTESYEETVTWEGLRDEREWMCIRVPRAQFPDSSLTSILNQTWGNPLDYGDFRLEAIDPKLIETLRPRRAPLLLSRMAEASRPLLAMVLKPSWHLTLEERIQIATEFVTQGGDLVKEDETYFPQPERLIGEGAEIQQALNAISASKRGLGIYVPHISGSATNQAFLTELESAGVQAGMISFLSVGLDTVRRVAENTGLFLWGHRVGYEAYRSTLGMGALAQLAWGAGFNGLHIGTPVISNPDRISQARSIVEHLRVLDASCGVTSWAIVSKTTEEISEALVQTLGPNIILLGCGAFLGPSGVNPKAMKSWINTLRQTGGI
jgi:ribulose bisphosphate carboxylase large subunit-like protein